MKRCPFAPASASRSGPGRWDRGSTASSTCSRPAGTRRASFGGTSEPRRSSARGSSVRGSRRGVLEGRRSPVRYGPKPKTTRRPWSSRNLPATSTMSAFVSAWISSIDRPSRSVAITAAVSRASKPAPCAFPSPGTGPTKRSWASGQPPRLEDLPHPQTVDDGGAGRRPDDARLLHRELEDLHVPADAVAPEVAPREHRRDLGRHLAEGRSVGHVLVADAVHRRRFRADGCLGVHQPVARPRRTVWLVALDADRHDRAVAGEPSVHSVSITPSGFLSPWNVMPARLGLRYRSVVAVVPDGAAVFAVLDPADRA